MTRLTVAVRVRPLSDRELSAKSVSIVSVENGKTVAVTNVKVPEQNAGDSRERVRRFTFDYCFDSESTQNDVYQNIGKEIAKAIKRRFHSCILAYGQSSSGKTHTMLGENNDLGLAPRLCQNIFDYLAETAVGCETDILKATVSYLEIYNEKVRDLLDPDTGSKQGATLKVREHPQKGPYVQGLSEKPALDADGLLHLLHIGNTNRTVGATNANPKSSRSHSVFTVTCNGGLKLRLVDLAGSERAGSRSHTTSRFREGANINKSLVALRNVISALADRTKLLKLQRKRFIPYRDSILTWLLKDTLSGNSRTILISNISPSNTCYTETVNTLRFGQRAKQIIVQPLVNEDPKERTIRELRAEIARLKELLSLNQVHLALVPKENKALEEESCTNWEEVEELSSDSGATSDECNELNANLIDGNTFTLPKEKEAFEEENYTNWEEAEEFSNDSGFTSSTTSFEEDELISPGELKNLNINKKLEGVACIDELIPVMEVSSDVTKKFKSPLRRTFSVDHRGDAKTTSKLFSSHEALKSTSSGLRKSSIDRPRLEKPLPKSEKGTGTEGKSFAKFEVKSKIDSYRKPLIKPRSQIVAAVTQRLYNKVKKKEASTETEPMTEEPPVPKELSICSNARLRLQELTQKALKAHRRKDVDTQTDLFPVLRVKEMSTDVDDLQIMLKEIRHIDISTDVVVTKDNSTNCCLISDTKGAFLLTRTCGTSTEKIEERPVHVISFRKYLQDHPKPQFEIINPHTSTPIYTSSVNINVNHNYINNKNEDNISDDSLEEQLPPINFPTPDLISNHNSLEQPSTSNNAKFRKDLRFANTEAIAEEFEVNGELSTVADFCLADSSISPRCEEIIDDLRFQTFFAPEVYILENPDDDHEIFYQDPPQLCKANIIQEPLLGPAKVIDPPIFKSIMKHNICDSCMQTSDEESCSDKFDNIPDSLNYYHHKKKVRFNESPSNGEMFTVMSSFMKEVTTLMSNLTKVANKFDTEQDYDLQLTVNDVQGLPRHKCKTKRQKNRKRTAKPFILHSESTQTSPITTKESSTQDDVIPVNKYESILESSCDRLEKLVQKIETTREELDLHKFPQPFSITSWNYRQNLPEDSSLESNPTFSDYGSLPRRKYTRERHSSCSPSGYLRQLTTMRKQIVETSREELLNEAQIDL